MISSILKLTAGLLWHDRFLLPVFFGLLASALLFQEFALTSSLVFTVGSLFIERVVVLFIQLILVLRWAKVFRVTKAKQRTGSAFSIIRYFLFGIGIWISIGIPLLLLPLALQSQWQLPVTVLLALGVLTALRLFFYFLPVPLGIYPFARALHISKEISSAAPWLQFKTFFLPLAWMVLLMNISLAPAPDGRSELWNTLASLAECIFWLLSCYTALAAGLLFLSESTWRELGFDPYRKERLASIEIRAPKGLQQLAEVKFTSLVLSLGILLSIGNHMRFLTTMPAAKIRELKIENDVKNVDLDMTLTDEQFHFRGFTPYGLYLAGESGIPVSKAIASVKIDGKDEGYFGSFQEKGEKIRLEISYEVDRSPEDLKKLEDLWLWYNNVKLIHLTPYLHTETNSASDIPDRPRNPHEHKGYQPDPHIQLNPA